MSDFLPVFEWRDDDWERRDGGVFAKPEARERYRDWMLATGSVSREAVLDNIVSEAELRARDWEYDPLS